MAKLKTKRGTVSVKGAKKKSVNMKGKKRPSGNSNAVAYEEPKRSELPIIIFGLAFCALLIITLIAIFK